MSRVYNASQKLKILHTRQHGLCALCGKSLKLVDANLDHRVPRALGGLGSYGNLQATHRTCNSAKGAIFIGDPLSVGDLSRLPLPVFVQIAKPAKHARRGKRGMGCS